MQLIKITYKNNSHEDYLCVEDGTSALDIQEEIETIKGKIIEDIKEEYELENKEFDENNFDIDDYIDVIFEALEDNINGYFICIEGEIKL